MEFNVPLLIFDVLCLPIHLIRLIIIYFYGSKYNIRGFRFLDVMMHSDKPFFNHDCGIINTIETDYRVVIRDDSRIYPIDLDKWLKLKPSLITVDDVMSSSIETVEDLSTDTDQSADTSADNRLFNKNKLFINKNKESVLDSIMDELDSALDLDLDQDLDSTVN